MKKLSNPYLISFSGLKDGEHKFDYLIDDAFFKNRDYSEVKSARIETDVLMTKSTNLLVFDVKMEGTIQVECDRCGDEFPFPVWGERKLIVSLTNDRFDEGDDIVSIPLESSEIDITQYLYEYIILLLPQRRIHPDKEDGSSGCNPEAIKMLDRLSAREDDKSDPRWDALKNIKQN